LILFNYYVKVTLTSDIHLSNTYNGVINICPHYLPTEIAYSSIRKSLRIPFISIDWNDESDYSLRFHWLFRGYTSQTLCDAYLILYNDDILNTPLPPEYARYAKDVPLTRLYLSTVSTSVPDLLPYQTLSILIDDYRLTDLFLYCRVEGSLYGSKIL